MPSAAGDHAQDHSPWGPPRKVPHRAPGALSQAGGGGGRRTETRPSLGAHGPGASKSPSPSQPPFLPSSQGNGVLPLLSVHFLVLGPPGPVPQAYGEGLRRLRRGVHYAGENRRAPLTWVSE